MPSLKTGREFSTSLIDQNIEKREKPAPRDHFDEFHNAPGVSTRSA
jgi:hypothetical protein